MVLKINCINNIESIEEGDFIRIVGKGRFFIEVGDSDKLKILDEAKKQGYKLVQYQVHSGGMIFEKV